MEEEPVEPDSGVDVEECEVEPNACALQEPLNLRLGFTARRALGSGLGRVS